MIIQYMKLKGFRKHQQELEINFSDKETYITGGNYKGKTTIIYAIIWAFLGTNPRGNAKENLINRDSEESLVEIRFTDNKGEEHTLIRMKRQIDGKTIISLDGRIADQEELGNYYGSAHLFLSIINPDYFKSFPPAKQKEIIDKYLPNIPIDVVMKNLSADEQAKIKIPHNNPKLYIKGEEEEIEQMQSTIINNKAKIDYATKITTQELGEEQEFTKQKELDLLYKERDTIKQNSNTIQKEALQEQIADTQAQVLNTKNKIDKINEKGKNARTEYDEIASSPNSLCPTCMQELAAQSKLNALTSKKKEMIDLSNEKTSLEKQLQELESSKILLIAKMHSLGENKTTRNLEDVLNDISILEQEQRTIDIFNREIIAKRNSIQTAETDIKKLQEENKMLETEINKSNILIDIAKKLYFMTIQEKMAIAKQYMPSVDIRFDELVKSTRRDKGCFCNYARRRGVLGIIKVA